MINIYIHPGSFFDSALGALNIGCGQIRSDCPAVSAASREEVPAAAAASGDSSDADSDDDNAKQEPGGDGEAAGSKEDAKDGEGAATERAPGDAVSVQTVDGLPVRTYAAAERQNRPPTSIVAAQAGHADLVYGLLAEEATRAARIEAGRSTNVYFIH